MLAPDLDERPAAAQAPVAPLRFAVWAIDAEAGGIEGAVLAGAVTVGDAVVVAASGREARVRRILGPDGETACAAADDYVTLVLSEEADVGVGDLLAAPGDRPTVADRFEAQIDWRGAAPADDPARAWWLRLGSRLVLAHLETIEGRVRVRTAAPVAFDAFADQPATGRFRLFARADEAAVAEGRVLRADRGATNVHRQASGVDRRAREALNGHRGAVLWFTGLSGSGKSTVADRLERRLHARGVRTMLLDGDNLRHGLNADLGFSDADRAENMRRAGAAAALFAEAGVVTLCCLISPSREERARVRAAVGEADFIEVFVDAPLELCAERDPKGLYAKAYAGKLPGFTGVHSPYEAPMAPELTLATAELSPDAAAETVLALLTRRGVLARAPEPTPADVTDTPW